MKQIDYVIQDEMGLHARPAGQLVRAVKEFQSKVTLRAGEREAPCNRLIALMGLQIKHGSPVTFTVEGEDEEQAFAELSTLLRDHPI